jgi:hypothetical protein
MMTGTEQFITSLVHSVVLPLAVGLVFLSRDKLSKLTEGSTLLVGLMRCRCGIGRAVAQR